MSHSAAYFDLRHDFFRVCAFVFWNALLCNFLPSSVLLRKYPKTRYCYEVLVDLVAGFGLNWRTKLPSLDAEFLGFKRIAQQTYRSWRPENKEQN
jgi:hypothetical protein